MATPQPDLSSLTAGERAVLTLLAEGHTAKSIAAQTGRTVGAVNERLRDARRKTGIGSSRELARLLRAQENRPEQIGVPASAAAIDANARAAAITPWSRVGGFVMVSTALATAAVLLLAWSHGGGAMPTDGEQDPQALHRQVRAEPRDERWAGAAEAALRAHYAGRPGLTSVTVTCATTLCEAAGQMNGPERAIRTLVRDIQVGPLAGAIRTPALTFEAVRISAAPAVSFATYWARADVRPKP